MVSTCHSRLIPAISRSFVNQYATLDYRSSSSREERRGNRFPDA